MTAMDKLDEATRRQAVETARLLKQLGGKFAAAAPEVAGIMDKAAGDVLRASKGSSSRSKPRKLTLVERSIAQRGAA